MNKFDFPNNLMEKHYNDSYLETEKFPNCTFKGFITDEINLLNSNLEKYKGKVWNICFINNIFIYK